MYAQLSRSDLDLISLGRAYPFFFPDHPPPLNRCIQAHSESERASPEIHFAAGTDEQSTRLGKPSPLCKRDTYACRNNAFHFCSCPPGDCSRVLPLPLGLTPPPLLSRRRQHPITTFSSRWRGLAYGMEEGEAETRAKRAASPLRSRSHPAPHCMHDIKGTSMPAPPPCRSASCHQVSSWYWTYHTTRPWLRPACRLSVGQWLD